MPGAGLLADVRKATRCALVFPGGGPGAMLGNSVRTQALRQAGFEASGDGLRVIALSRDNENGAGQDTALG